MKGGDTKISIFKSKFFILINAELLVTEYNSLLCDSLFNYLSMKQIK